MLALANQAISKIGTHVQCVVAVEARELKLAALGNVPDIVQDQTSVRGLFALAGIIGVIRNVSVDRNQAWLIGEAVITDPIGRQFMLAEIEDFRHVALVLLAMLQAL